MQVQTKQQMFHSNQQQLNMSNKQISYIMQTEEVQQNNSEDKNSNNININMHTNINIIISKPNSPQESPINCNQLTSINIHNNTQINTRTNQNDNYNQNYNQNGNDNGNQNMGKASKKGKHKYSKITPQIKKIFIQRIVFENMSIKQSAESVNINYSSAKAIISQHKNKSKPQSQQQQPQLQSQIKSQSSSPIAQSIPISTPIPFIICSYRQISEQFPESDKQSKGTSTPSKQNKYAIDAILSTIGGLVVDQWQCDQGNSKNISINARMNKMKK